jgi:para-nitrobenzyl esterase
MQEFIMIKVRLRRIVSLAGCCVLGLALTTATGRAASAALRTAPVVHTDVGAVRGMADPSGYEFLGLPYAAPPTGSLRWRPPQPVDSWHGVRDATQFAPSCPQSTDPSNVAAPPPPFSEDCLYLNIYTPNLSDSARVGRPVLVWIHGGGLNADGGRNYDGTKLAADGIVVVTINYRLGALGFLAHPALAVRPGGSTGNYGLMDQQAALRWVQRNIERFGGDPHDVTIAGESAGGLSVLAHLVSRGSRGLFQRAIVQSGAFALNQHSLADAEAEGEAFASSAGCPGQTAQCLRGLALQTILAKSPPFVIPGSVDGKVLTEPIGTAIAAGRFTHVPMLNGFNHNEEAIFYVGGAEVSGGTFVGAPKPITAENYEGAIESVLGVSDARAAAIAAQYPLAAFASPDEAFTTLVGDASFACPALKIDRQTSTVMPAFAYQFNDDGAPQPYLPPAIAPSVATHGSEMAYLFDLPNAPFPGVLNADQASLAENMRRAWANFAATGNPSSSDLDWPTYADGGTVMSLVTPKPHVESDSVAAHHCLLWDAG